MIRSITGSEVPIPGPLDGFRYGQTHAERIATNLQALRDTFNDWVTQDMVPKPEKPIGYGVYSFVEKAGDYARREPNDHGLDAEGYAENLVRGIDAHPRLERIRALSSKHTYSDLLSGTIRSLCSDENIAALERLELINSGLDVLTIMQARGLRLDTLGDNVLLHPSDGLAIVDYDIDPRQPLNAKVAHIAHKVIVRSGLTFNHRNISQRFRPDTANRLPALIRLNEIVQKRAAVAPDLWGRSAASTQKILDRVQYNLVRSRTKTT